MAKHCDVCKKTFPDEQTVCPHCGAEVGGAVQDVVGHPGDTLPGGAIRKVKTQMDPSPGESGDIDWAVLEDEDTSKASPSRSDILSGSSEIGPDSDVRLAAGGPASSVHPEEASDKRRPDLVETNMDINIIDQGPTVLHSPAESDAGASGPSSAKLDPLVDDEPGQTLTGADIAAAGEEASSDEIELDPVLAGEEEVADEEEPIAVAEEPVEEEAAVEEAAAEGGKKKKKKKEKTRAPGGTGGRGGMLIGAGAGLLVGVLACVALWMFGIEPPAGLRRAKAKPAETTAIAATTTPATAAPHAAPQVAEAAPTADAGREHLLHGDFDKATVVLAKVPGKDPALLASRGEARWLTYLQQKKRSKAPLSDKDADVTQARGDLTAAKNAAGEFWLGQMQEELGNAAEARATYAKGLTDYPAEHARFQAALDRLDTLYPPAAKPQNGPPAGGAPDKPSGMLTQALGVMVTGLQAPVNPRPLAPATSTAPATGSKASPKATAAQAKPADQPKASTEEAGYEFWKATKLAQEEDYPKAIDALRKAREIHESNRYARLHQAQNPVSDPTEQIFLRTCDELIQYWQLKEKLATSPPVAKQEPPAMSEEGKKAIATVAAVTEKLKAQNLLGDGDVPTAVAHSLEAKAKADQQTAAVRAALEQAKLGGDQDPADAVKKLVAEHQQAVDAQASAAELLKAANFVPAAGADLPKAVGRALEALHAADQKARDTAGKLQAEETILSQITQNLAGTNHHVANHADLPKAVAAVLSDTGSPAVTALRNGASEMTQLAGNIGGAVGDIVDLSRRLARSQAENVHNRLLLGQSRTPDQMLDVWLALLEDPRRQGPAEGALRDAKRVSQDPQLRSQTRAEALAVEGLALRNQGKLTEAREALEHALQNGGKPTNGDWQTIARAALDELRDPNAYFVPQAEHLRSTGNAQAALALITQGTGAFAAGSPAAGRLLALRSELEMDIARGTGAYPTANAPEVAHAREDAQAAITAGAAAEGHYALGYIAEVLRDWPKAQQEYQQAYSAHGQADRTGARYRVALARALIRARGLTTPLSSSDVPSGTSSDQAPATTAAADANGRSAAAADLDRAVELADEAINAGEPDGYLVKAEALAAQERWRPALREYIRGLQRLFPSNYVDGLREIVDNQPAFRMPQAVKSPQPGLAEQFYVQGQRYYWARRYGAAEAAFTEAVRNNANDARILYYLGLARLQQGRLADAFEAFREAGQCEQLGKPSVTEIGAALERVQGPERTILDREAHRGG